MLDENPSPFEIQEGLHRVEASAAFATSARLSEFLRFIVHETLCDGGRSLKEVVIGNAVYQRDSSYDPRIDSTVRVEARRLRRKLLQYYEADGRSDPVRINLPTGTYVPRFSRGAQSSDELMGPGVGEGVLTVLPFLALSACTQDQLFADGLTDELIFAAQRTVGLRVTSRAVTFQYRQRECNLLSLARETGSRAILHGTVRGDGVMLKVTAELTEPSGLLIWSDRFTAPDQERSLLEEEMAQRIVARLRTRAMTLSHASRCQGAERTDA